MHVSKLKINGEAFDVDENGTTPLLRVLREHLQKGL
jgi:aerobic-type carbon monoxide dehydrogenase small subunit (CoxS/CutS family)